MLWLEATQEWRKRGKKGQRCRSLGEGNRDSEDLICRSPQDSTVQGQSPG